MALSSFTSPRRRPPRPPGHWLLGNVPEFQRAPLAYLEDVVDRYGDVVELRAGHQRAVLQRATGEPTYVLVCAVRCWATEVPGGPLRVG